MTRSPPRVFLTGAGGAGTIEVLRALRATKRYEIVTGDASPHAAGYALADRSYVLPMATDPVYPEVLRRLLTAERPDLFVPLIDEEIALVHRTVPDCSPETRVVAPRLEFVELAADKWRMAEALAAAGLSTARTWLASDAAGASYPAIVKPRTGRGSRGFALLDSAADLARYLAKADPPADRYVVQERVDGVEYTTSVVVALGGPTLAVVPKEATVKKGITQVGITRRVPAIDALARAIQDHLHADGPFNVQCIVDAAGVPKVIEVNPRYSTTVALTLAAGVDEVDLVLRRALGEPVEAPPFVPDLMMVRYTAQLYVPESEWKPIEARR